MVGQLDKSETAKAAAPPPNGAINAAPVAEPPLPPGLNFEAALKAAVFNGLMPEQVKEFLALGEPRSYKANDIIIREGDTDTDMYILLRGKLDITKKIPAITPGGDEQQKSLFQPVVPQMMGIFPFGDMNLLAGLGRSATIVALEDSDTVVISKQAFEELCERDPRLGYVMTRNIAQNVVKSLITTNGQVAKLTTALTLALQKRN